MPINNFENEFKRAQVLEQQSEYVQEIISSRPGFLVRYGISIFLLVLILILAISWFVKYPDVINSKATLISVNSPKPVVTLQPGKLVAWDAREDEQVTAGQVVGKIESLANDGQVLKLFSKLNRIRAYLQQPDEPFELNGLLSDTSFYQTDGKLGELQPAHQEFSMAVLSFKNYCKYGFYARKKQMLQSDLIQIRRMKSNLIEQKEIFSQDLSLAQETFKANESLKKDKVISDFDFRQEQSKVLSKKMSLPQINASLLSNESQQAEKQKEIMELDNTITQQRQIFLQALNSYKSKIEEWKRNYLISAPMAGRVALVSTIQVNQQIKANQILCYINPQESRYYAELTIPQSNFGKVFNGQMVLLKFPSYPFQEYGAVKATIDFISHIPTDSGYTARLSFGSDLNTTYGKKIQYREGLTASAEIITRNVRLLERFYYGIIKNIRN
jgi:biotin carboxyl carrier protein